MRKSNTNPISSPKNIPALDPETREKQMISYAEALAESQLRDGTASSQVITHYLKLGSSRERLEKEILEEKIKVMEKKIEMMESTKHVEELYAEALASMKTYKGEE